jgi:hypothetical protein
MGKGNWQMEESGGKGQELRRRVLAFGLGVVMTILFFLPEILGVKTPAANATRSWRLNRSHQLRHLTQHTGCTFGANRD